MQENQELINQVKAHFILKNTSLARFLLEKAIDPSNAKKALHGKWKGDKATEICNLITEETGITITPSDNRPNRSAKRLKIINWDGE